MLPKPDQIYLNKVFMNSRLRGNDYKNTNSFFTMYFFSLRLCVSASLRRLFICAYD
jgi:hypothetical protein